MCEVCYLLLQLLRAATRQHNAHDNSSCNSNNALDDRKQVNHTSNMLVLQDTFNKPSNQQMGSLVGAATAQEAVVTVPDHKPLSPSPPVAPRSRPKLFFVAQEEPSAPQHLISDGDVQSASSDKSQAKNNGTLSHLHPPLCESLSLRSPSLSSHIMAPLLPHQPAKIKSSRPPLPLVHAIRPSQLKILHKIGKGASGSVYKAEWQDCMCALKMPHEAVIQDCIHARTLVQEAAVLSTIRHPNVVSCFGTVVEIMEDDVVAGAASSCAVDTQHLIWRTPACGILLEFCSGGSLRDLMSSPTWDRTPWWQRLRWALDAATGLAFLHEREIVHRDIKSPNLLLENGRLKVGDFGLARFFTSSIGATTAKTVGSPAWMAPEVITNGTRISPPSDIFSFGVVLWELMTGHIPWQSSNSMHVMYQVVCNAARPALPRLPLPSLPAGYINLIQECWMQAPESRPACAIVVERLREMLQGVEQQRERQLEGMYM